MPGRRNLHCHLGYFESDRLVAADLLAERLTLLCVLRRMFHRPSAYPDGGGSHHRTRTIEYLHRNLEGAAFFAEPIAFGNPDLIENNLRAVGRPLAHFVFLFPHADAAPFAFNYESAHAMVPANPIRICKDDKEMSVGAVGDEILGPA